MRKLLSVIFPLALVSGCETIYVAPDGADIASVRLVLKNPKNAGFWDVSESLSVYVFENSDCEGRSRIVFFNSRQKNNDDEKKQIGTPYKNNTKIIVQEVRIGASKKQTLLFNSKVSAYRANGVVTYSCGVLIDVTLSAGKSYEMMFERANQYYCEVEFAQLLKDASLEKNAISTFKSGFEEDRQACWEVNDKL